jgi:hypothetical protein
MVTDIQIYHTAAIDPMDHHHLLGRSEDRLGNGMEDLIPGFRPGRHLQLTL